MDEHEQLLTLRRKVRHDSDISMSAAALFADICDMHEDNGCFARDDHFAGRYDVHEKTVARWRRELQKHGYIRRKQDGDGLLLVPNLKIVAQPQNCGNASKSTGEEQNRGPQKRGQTTDQSPQNRGTLRDDNPAEASESAPARDDQKIGEQQRFEKLRDLAAGTYTREQVADHAETEFGEPQSWRTAIYQLAHPDYSPQHITQLEWREEITDPAAWAEAVLKGWKRKWQPHTTDAREDTYQDIIDNRTKVTEDGKLAGTPEPDVQQNARGYPIQ